MKRLIIFILSIILYTNLFAEENAVVKAKALIQSAESKNLFLIEKIASERKALIQKLALQKEATEQAKLKLVKESEKQKALNRESRELKKSGSERAFELKRFRKTVHASAKELLANLQDSFLSYPNAGSKGQLEAAINKQGSYELAKTLLVLAEQEIDQAKGIQKKKVNVFNSRGKKVEAEVVVLGKIQAFYRSDDEVGILKPFSPDNQLYAIKGTQKLSSDIVNNLFNSDQVNLLPLDASSGGAIKREEARKSVKQWFAPGGIIAWVIASLGIVALLLTFERLITIMSVHKNVSPLMDGLSNASMNLDQAETWCASHKGAVSRVLHAGLKQRGKDRNTFENAMQEAILQEMPSLEKHLSYLNIIAASAPLLGLLGTVTGMITTFDVIALFGNADSKLISGGISEALVTTQMGLIVAVPTLLLHNFISSKVDQVADHMEANAVAMANHLERDQGTGESNT